MIHPQAMGQVPGIVYRAIATHLVHKADLQLKDGATGAVTLVQRFGSVLYLNIHFHILSLDGVYVYRDNRPPRFRRVRVPNKGDLEDLISCIIQRVGAAWNAGDCWNRTPRMPGWIWILPKTPIPCRRFWVIPSPTASPAARSKGARPS